MVVLSWFAPACKIIRPVLPPLFTSACPFLPLTRLLTLLQGCYASSCSLENKHCTHVLREALLYATTNLEKVLLLAVPKQPDLTRP